MDSEFLPGDLPSQTSTTAETPPAVLVVEDNVSNFQLVARMLEALGMRCEWKTSGYEVLEYAEALLEEDLPVFLVIVNLVNQ